MNKKRVLIIVAIGLAVLVSIVIAVVMLVDKPQVNEPNNNDDDIIAQNIRVTGKLKQYIESMTNNYYIKYSGKFKDNSGELKDAVVEYTKSGEDFGIRALELGMQMICQGEKLYSVSNEYKMIVEMGRESFDISEYNFASDIGQIFVKTYKEKVGNTEYDVEEYLYNGKALKYYFNINDLKLIKYEDREIKIIRLEKKTNSELLVKPEGYKYAIV